MSTPRFLADEDLRREIVLAVRRIEPQITFATVVESGIAGSDDDEVLEFAYRGKWLVVSHDVNTMSAHANARIQEGRGMAGLLLAPQSYTTKPVAESLALIWSASQAEEWDGRIVYLPL